MYFENLFLVSLPSAVQTVAKTQLEIQNLIKASKANESGDKSSTNKETEATESEEESESDNEEIFVTELKPIPESDDVNLDDEFEKIVPFKFKKLSEESLDEVDHEIEEILHEAKPLGSEVKSETEIVKAEGGSGKVFEVVKVEEDELETEQDSKHEEAIEPEKAHEKVLEPEQASSDPKTLQTEVNENQNFSLTEKKAAEAPINDAKLLETNIDDIQAPTDAPLLKENSEDKPPVPIQTYLWEDVKKSKEQVSGDNVCTFHLFHAAHLHDNVSNVISCSIPNLFRFCFNFFR